MFFLTIRFRYSYYSISYTPPDSMNDETNVFHTGEVPKAGQ